MVYCINNNVVFLCLLNSNLLSNKLDYILKMFSLILFYTNIIAIALCSSASKQYTFCPNIRNCLCGYESVLSGLLTFVRCKHNQASPSQAEMLSRHISQTVSDSDNSTIFQATNSPLNKIPDAICLKKTWIEIDIRTSLIDEIPKYCLKGMIKIRSIIISNSRVVYVHDGLFADLSDLQLIDLSFNNLELFEGSEFYNMSDLTSLEVIILEANSLTSLEPWPIVRASTYLSHLPNLSIFIRFSRSIS